MLAVQLGTSRKSSSWYTTEFTQVYNMRNMGGTLEDLLLNIAFLLLLVRLCWDLLLFGATRG